LRVNRTVRIADPTQSIRVVRLEDRRGVLSIHMLATVDDYVAVGHEGRGISGLLEAWGRGCNRCGYSSVPGHQVDLAGPRILSTSTYDSEECFVTPFGH
jgi:hypothetical protein